MKSLGTVESSTGLWNSPNTGATNSSGFNGLPGGYRSYGGPFFAVGQTGNWWTSSLNTNDNTLIWKLALYYNSVIPDASSISKKYGFSVRCVKN